jgi:hypothetical protein
MLLGNTILIYMGTLPLVFIILSLSLIKPIEVSVVKRFKDQEAQIDEVITLSFDVTINGGLGLVSIGCPLPLHFALEDGSNFKTLWKGYGEVEDKLCFDVKCTKRGVYRIGEVLWETQWPFQLTSNVKGKLGDLCTLVVMPRYFNVRRVRDKKIFTKMPMPTEAKILLGVTTTDFKEIREYKIGDPYKAINWKATARLQYRVNKPPMVNEFEREGRKVVWIVLNIASRMFKGSTTQNCFEYAVQAVLELSEFYLSRNCKVGLIFFNDDFHEGNPYYHYLHRGELILPGITDGLQKDQEGKIIIVRPKHREGLLIPDSGREQHNKITEEILRMRYSSLRISLSESIRNVRGHIIGSRPLFIIITAVDEEREQLLLDGLREISKFSPRRTKEQKPILLVHVSGHELVEADMLSAGFRDLEDQIVVNRLTDVATTVQWNPQREGLSYAIIRQVSK